MCPRSLHQDGVHQRTMCSVSRRLEVGTSIARYVIVAARGEGDFVARGADGRTALVAVGNPLELAREATALEALSGGGPFPRLLATGHDSGRGAYVALTAPPAEATALDAVAAELPLDRVIALLRQILDAGATLDRAGFGWRPLPTDFYLSAEGVLHVARIRGALLANEGDRIDARALLEGVGGLLLEGAALRGRPRLIRLLKRRGVEGSAERTIREVRRELDALEDDLA